jgi:hypothetical protein
LSLDRLYTATVPSLGRWSGFLLLWFCAAARADILVSNGGQAYRVTAFADGATGNVAPLRTIEGAQSNFQLPAQMYADTVHGELYVANDLGSRVSVYPLGSSGNVAPLRTIEGAATGLDESGGVTVDLVHDEIVVVNFDNGHDGSVTVYPRLANGNVAPLRTIKGAATGLRWAVNAAVDPVAGEIFVTCQGDGSAQGTPGVRVFSRTANGNVAPLRTLTGPATHIDTPYGIFLDRPHGEILITDRGGWVSAFARAANGNAAPLRRIAGAQTGLLETLGVAVLGDSEIVVANDGEGGNNYSDDAVLVFPRTANGNLAPSRRINGLATQVTGPVGVAVVEPQLLLGGGRFVVEATWTTPPGERGGGQPVALTADTGYFWFFNASNVEVVLKVLDGCGLNSRYWVFAGGLTNVRTALRVRDLESGLEQLYVSPQSTAFQPLQDTGAFAACP